MPKLLVPAIASDAMLGVIHAELQEIKEILKASLFIEAELQLYLPEQATQIRNRAKAQFLKVYTKGD